MLLLGCKPQGRNTEQHDVFFGIGNELKELLPDIYAFWPEAKKNLHLDAWREVTHVAGYDVQVQPSQSAANTHHAVKLFFLNLGGYKPNEFDEFHYKMLVACNNKAEAVEQAKRSAFYKHTGFKGAASHIDDKYGVGVDEVYEIENILPAQLKEEYNIVLSPIDNSGQDQVHLGYVRLEKLH